MPPRPHRPENMLGLVGMCSVVIATVLSPTGICGLPLFVLVPMGFGGLGMCAVSLAWRPRWPGITGLIVGVSCLAIWACLFAWPILAVRNDASRHGMTLIQYIQMHEAAFGLFEEAEAQRQANGSPVAAVMHTSLPPDHQTDAWGRPYRYILNNSPRGFTFVSDGADGVASTSDDIDLAAIQGPFGTFELPPISASAAGSGAPSGSGR